MDTQKNKGGYRENAERKSTALGQLGNFQNFHPEMETGKPLITKGFPVL